MPNKPQSLVPTLEQCRRLVELGVEMDTYFRIAEHDGETLTAGCDASTYVPSWDDENKIFDTGCGCCSERYDAETFPAPTAAELLEFMPDEIQPSIDQLVVRKHEEDFSVGYWKYARGFSNDWYCITSSVSGGLAMLLIRLLEEEVITVDELRVEKL